MLYQHLKIVRKVLKHALLVVPLLVVLFFLLHTTQVPTFLSTASHAIGTPIWSVKNTISNIYLEHAGALHSKEALYAENQLLKEEIVRLQRSTFMYTSLQEDYTMLYNLLNYTVNTSGYITASVLHDTMLSAYDIFIVDRGADEGVRENMLILSPEGIALGYISEIFDNTAVARRFSSPSINIDVVVQASTTIHATLTGYGSNTMKLTVPRDVELSKGDHVLLPTLSTHPVGEVASITVSPENAYKTAYVQSPVNMYELRFVYIDTTQTWNTDSLTDQVTILIRPKKTEEDQDESETNEDSDSEEGE